jgi:predicted patatin/cPLA2 family phospholipase
MQNSRKTLVNCLRGSAALALGVVFMFVVAWPPLPAVRSADLSIKSGLAHAASKDRHKSRTKTKAKPKTRNSQTPTKKGPPPRTAFTVEDQDAAVVPGFPNARVWGDSAADFRKVLPTVNGPWLAMSGGGADGAFAAGVLTGWSQSGNRPAFSVVTGASIGALIAPYAFLGPKYDEELRTALTTITAADIFEDRLTPESFLDTWPLRRLIEKRVTPELVAGVAAEHRKGRRLLVVTTNVDAGRRVIWNMGAIAEQGGDRALKLFRDVLLASAAIPGFFPPVMINVEANGRKFQEMHIDGSVISPLFVAPEVLLEAGTNIRIPATELYLVLNSKLAPEFYMPERATISILSRLIGVVLKAGLRAELLLFATNAQRIGIPIEVAQVGQTFKHPAHGLFDQKYMNALYQYGLDRALKGIAFASITPSKPAPRPGTP